MIDVFATAVLGLLILVAASGVLLASPFLVMATDSAGTKPRMGALGWAYAVTWGGVVAGVTGAAFGVIRAIRRDAVMWVWPAAGLAVIAVCLGAGVLLAGRVSGRAD